MSDVRALLKAKRQEVRINHPFATYSSTGQLRCTACGTIVKQASSWQGHLGSKLHRTNVIRLKEAVLLEETQRVEGKEEGKRKAEGGSPGSNHSETKRRRNFQDNADEEGRAASVIPRDFFSNISQEPVLSASRDSEGAEPSSVSPSKELSIIDLEWEMFQRDVVKVSDHQETYDQATLVAEPEIFSPTMEGLPYQRTDDTQVNISNQMDEETRRRQEQDERELIMDRLLDEERAQEDADLKVSVLKGKLDALKQQRHVARSKVKSGTS